MKLSDHAAELKRYRDWAPSQFDTRGLNLPDRQDWIVAPVIRTRDSGVLEESNFASALESLGGESETVEVHRFGHWGPGWFEILLVDPSRAESVAEIACALADYPILNEHDHSEREWEAACECWASFSVRERVQAIKRHGNGEVSIFAARRDEFPGGGFLIERINHDA